MRELYDFRYYGERLMLTLHTTLPLETRSEANGRGLTRGAAIAKSRRVKRQRSEVFLHLLGAWGRFVPREGGETITVTLTRIAPRQLDPGDNLPNALKACRDSVADYIAGAYLAGNDRQAGLTWQYQQRRGKPHEMAVSIELRRVAHVLEAVEMGGRE